MSFFDALNFASSNEDGLTEITALGDANRILCLTGSGTRPLDLLVTEASEVVAIDLNPTQNALLALKIAAFKALSYDEVLTYLGIEPCTDRLALHRRVEGQLSGEMLAFWVTRSGMIRRGVWYAGRWEKVLRAGAKGIGLLRGRKVERLFAARDVGEQAAIWARDFDDWIWRGSIRLLGRPWIWTKVIGEPGGAFLPSPDEVEARLAGAFRTAAGRFLFRDSEFASLILRGTNERPGALPVHLREAHFEQVRTRLDRIKIAQGGLSDLNRLELGAFDGFSLSDFGSYCDRAAYDACWAGVLSNASRDALFCERVFMNPLTPTQPRVSIDRDLSHRLTVADRGIIYDIRAGRISD